VDNDNKVSITLVQNQNFLQPFRAEGPPTIYTLQPPFMLTEADFRVLKSDRTALSSIALNLVASLSVLVVSFAIRWVHALQTQDNSGPEWIDWVTLVVLGVLTGACWIGSCIWPGRRTALTRDIEEHFEQHRPLFGSGKTHGR
jgi:hypothetical protein